MLNTEKLINQDLIRLNSILLATLDESIFFGELSKFIKDNLELENIRIYKALDNGRSQLILDQAKHIENGEILEKGKSLSGYVINTKRAYFSNNIERDPLFASFGIVKNVKAELAIPLVSEGTVLATIHMQSNEDEAFGQELINDVIEITKKLSGPINNMKMYLAAKKLNETLLKKIEENEKELAKRVEVKVESKSTTEEREIIGKSPEIKKVTDFIGRIAPTSSNILVLGESGTGKELIARKIHCLSDRKSGEYVVINCGAIQESLLESEFFGHEKGSFTGAMASKEGLVEKAHNGTLFLDEVGELSPSMQTKLLRFIEQKEAYRVGGVSPYKVDVRIIAATNRDLKKEVEEGRFREDLYYRLNTITVNIPSLKERKTDIILLANKFLNENKSIEEQKTLTPSAISLLNDYHWPGNIRELKNVMERAYILSDGNFIDESLLGGLEKAEEVIEEKPVEFSEMTLSDLEKKHICNTLEHLGGNKTKTAKVLGITVKTLYNKLHSYGMIQSRDALA